MSTSIWVSAVLDTRSSCPIVPLQEESDSDGPVAGIDVCNLWWFGRWRAWGLSIHGRTVLVCAVNLVVDAMCLPCEACTLRVDSGHRGYFADPDKALCPRTQDGIDNDLWSLSRAMSALGNVWIRRVCQVQRKASVKCWFPGLPVLHPSKALPLETTPISKALESDNQETYNLCLCKQLKRHGNVFFFLFCLNLNDSSLLSPIES